VGSKGDQPDSRHTSPYPVLIWLINHRQPFLQTNGFMQKCE